MGSRRELLASAAFIGVVVLGFQAVDPLRNRSAGAVMLNFRFQASFDDSSCTFLFMATYHSTQETMVACGQPVSASMQMMSRRAMGNAACRAYSTRRKASSCAAPPPAAP